MFTFTNDKVFNPDQTLHFSLMDALDHSTGFILHYVKDGEHQWFSDVTLVLRLFARHCALDVIDLWNAPDVVIEYLKTGDDNLRIKARDAANAAYNSAVMSAARSTPLSIAAYYAADAACHAATVGAAVHDAYDAYCTVHYAVKAKPHLRFKQSKRLVHMIFDAVGEKI